MVITGRNEETLKTAAEKIGGNIYTLRWDASEIEMADRRIDEAAKLMGKTESFVRIGLQRKLLPFGFAVKTGRERWSYFISKPKFEESTGISAKTEED